MVQHPRESGAKSRAGQAEKSKSSSDGPSDSRPGFKAGGKAGGKSGGKSAPGKPAKMERVAKALARAGVASRREVERLVGLGKVAVNGRILDTPAVLVSRDDILTVDGAVVNAPEATRLWRYHKPVGLVTTHRDPQDRPTVFHNLPEGLPRVVSVGRLDLNSEGLLLLTNDGALARALEMPSNAWRRVYRVRAHGHATQEKLDKLMAGTTVEGVQYGPIEAKLEKAKENRTGGANIWLTVALTEGKNREVRRVLEAIGLKVNRLIRVAYGPFQLGTLESGSAEEVGPRVIREQLETFITPENMPTGDRTTTPLSRPGRRPGGVTSPANAMADPSRKPSRVRALAEKSEAEGKARPDKSRPDKPRGTLLEGGERGYKRDSAGRPFKPRSPHGDVERPARGGGHKAGGYSAGGFRGGGDKAPGDSAPGDRPPGDRPPGDRPSGYKGAGYKGSESSGPRPERAGGGDRPYKARAEGERPAREGAERAFKPRGEAQARPGGKPAYGKGAPRSDRPRGPGGPGGPKAGFKAGGRPSGPGGGGRPAGRPAGKPGGKPGGGPRGPKR